MTRRLSIALSQNAMTAPLLSGAVRAEGVELDAAAVHPSEMFWRQLRFGDFDVSEMSIASLMISAALGRRDWVALPVFTSRRFFHTRMVVHRDSGIEEPADLKGRRVGVPEYQQTAAVWTRAALQHEFGVLPRDLEWFMERPLDRSHGGATAFVPPAGVRLSHIEPSATLGGMLSNGLLDAAVVYTADRNLVDRTRAAANDVPTLRTLFADPVAEGLRYFAATGILPVNHCVVVRRELHEQAPWIYLNLYAAFLEAHDQVLARAVGAIEPWAQLGTVDADTVARLRAADPLPYGVKSQKAALEAIPQYLLEQGLVNRLVALDEIFDERGLVL